jgi:hypothetical protein
VDMFIIHGREHECDSIIEFGLSGNPLKCSVEIYVKARMSGVQSLRTVKLLTECCPNIIILKGINTRNSTGILEEIIK